MRAVIQRVRKGRVSVNKRVLAVIKKGLVVLVGVENKDTDQDISYIVDKIRNLRLFDDQEGKLNLSVKEIGGEVMVISQFTLLGDARKGRRPSYTRAAGADEAKVLYKRLIEKLKEEDLKVKAGEFGARMLVEIDNNGPVTVLLDSKKEF